MTPLSPSQWGLLLGLAGAACQACNYAVTKACQERYRLTGLRLLTAEHVMMWLMVIVPFVGLGYYRTFNLHVACCLTAVVIPYLAAQYAVNQAITLAEASIVSPLMAVKIPILALICVLFFGQRFAAGQIAAVVAILGLAWYLSAISGKIRLLPLAYTAAGCLCFSLSDLAITALTHELQPLPRAEAVAAAIMYEYVVAGALALPAVRLCRLKAREIGATWKLSLLWLLSMVGIIGCFNLSGVVEGNVIQTLRGAIGVIVAYAFYRRYIRDRRAFRKKLGIAVGMTAAVALYYL